MPNTKTFFLCLGMNFIDLMIRADITFYGQKFI
jgi:hypothetical protein